MINIEPVEGFEPTTPRLQITCSGQLSYTGFSIIKITKKRCFLPFLCEVQIYNIFLFRQQKYYFFMKKVINSHFLPPLL